MVKLNSITRLIGMKVCVLQNSNPVAKVMDVIYSKLKNKVVCLVVDTNEWFSSPKVIPFNLVDSSGDNLLISSARHIIEPHLFDVKIAARIEKSGLNHKLSTTPRWKSIA